MSFRLNTKVEDWGPGVHCCAPRWGHAAVVCGTTKPVEENCAQCCQERGVETITPGYMCNLTSPSLNEAVAKKHITPSEPKAEWMERVGSAYIGTQMIGDNIPGTFAAPTTLATAMGEAARYLMVDPAQELTIISMGSAKGWATNCWGGYDDAYTVALVWNLLGPALQVRNASAETAALLAAEERRLAAEREEDAVTADADGRKIIEEEGERAKAEVAASGVELQGSCQCYCRAEEGRGVCFNIGVGAGNSTKKSDKCGSLPHIKSANNTASFYNKQADFCSPLGTVTKNASVVVVCWAVCLSPMVLYSSRCSVTSPRTWARTSATRAATRPRAGREGRRRASAARWRTTRTWRRPTA